MNEFNTVSFAAATGKLPPSANSAYLASDAFRERTLFKGKAGSLDAVKVQLFLLSRLSLCPADVEVSRKRLQGGTVLLQYFGFSNPVVLFDIEVGSEEQATLLQAFDDNVASSMFKAALRVLKWRSWQLKSRRSRVEDAYRKTQRAMLVWPEYSAYSAYNRHVYEALYAESLAALNTACEAHRQTRHARLRLLSDGTHKGVTCAYELIEEIAIHALPPPLKH